MHSNGFGGFNFNNLGLVKLTGSMSAVSAHSLLRDHLAKFGVSLDDDIVSLTTDGASVMVIMGTYCQSYHQLCLAHGVQLAVSDTLYKNTKESPLVPIDETSDVDSESENSDADSVTNDSRLEIETTSARADPNIHKKLGAF